MIFLSCKVPAVLLYSVWGVKVGGGYRFASFSAHVDLPLHEIFIKIHRHFSLTLFVLPGSWDLSLGERGTYADGAPRINILQAADICPDILNREGDRIT